MPLRKTPTSESSLQVAAMARVTCVLLLLAGLSAVSAFQTSSVGVTLRSSSRGAISPLTHAKINRANNGRAAPPLRMQVFDDQEKAKASKELMQIRFETVNPKKFQEFIQRWPYGTKKDGFGLPKLMLPVQIDKAGAGVKLTFKGSLDPWLFVDLEGDTVRVYRQSMMSSSFMQVSALKEREEKKICDKLREDLQAVDCGASGLNEREIPNMEPEPEEEPEEEAAEGEEKAEAPAAEETETKKE